MARQTLRLFPNAQVQILDFNRTPKPRFPGFVPVRTAADALRLELARVQILEDGNGSEVDLALSEAERLLSAVTGVRTKRILLFTDALVPGRISPESITASVGKSGAIVNIVHVNGTKPELFEKNDEHPWSKAARSTGGLVWEPSNADEPGDTNDAKPDPYLALVRPTKLYNAVYSSPSSEEDLGDLGEGSGIERQGLYDVATRWARLSGELWSQPFRLTLYPDAKAGKLWSALVFGTEELSKLSEAEMMVLAQRGGAVSPVTSYLAIEPGVRPSTEGLTLDESSGGLGLMGSGEGSGSGYGAGSGSLGGHRPVDLQAFLEKQLAAKWAKCNGKPGKASVSLDTQYVEVADVRVKVDIPDPGQYDCLNEAAWSLDLRDQQFDEENMAWEIRL